MQLYTKILIGMGVGAVLGLFLGPQSPVLPQDSYKVGNAALLQFYMERSEEGAPVDLVGGGTKAVPLRLDIEESITESRTDALGKSHDIITWAKVSFTFSRDLAIRDKAETVRKALGGVKPGGKVTGWLRIKQTPLSVGGFSAFPEPMSGLGDTLVSLTQPVGKLFMRLLKMVIVPLVFASLLVGVASLGDVRKLGRLGGKTLGLYMATTAIAVTIGLIVAHIINPGSFVGEEARTRLQAQFEGAAGSKVDAAAEAPSTIDNILAIVPSNPIESLATGNMLQVIFFALLLGVALTFLDNRHGQPVVTFFDRINEAMVVIIHIVMKVAPYGVAALLFEVVGNSGLSILSALLVYSITVVIGLLLHAGLVYGSIVRILGKIKIREFLRTARPAQLIAFSTSSSSASLPVTMECAEENLGISNPVASFILPLGSTVNMDGTALYQGVAAIFIAQVFDIDLGLGGQLVIVLTATLASVGAAGVPGAGMVTLAMVLTQTGIPTVGVALILGMDRLLDMFRTAINVTGDLAVTAGMAASEGEVLRPLSKGEDRANPDRGFHGRLNKEQQPVEPED